MGLTRISETVFLPFPVGCEIMKHLIIYSILDLMEHMGGQIDGQVDRQWIEMKRQKGKRKDLDPPPEM